MIAATFARRIVHLSMADVVASLRRRASWLRATHTPTPSAALAADARRAIALQKAVERIRDGAAVNDVLAGSSADVVDGRFVVTAHFAGWLRARPKVSALLDIGGVANTRFLSGILAEHCDTVWLYASRRPAVIEIVSPIVIRTGAAKEAFGDGRRFPLVASLAGALIGNSGAGASGNPNSTDSGEGLGPHVDRLADLVAENGSLFAAVSLGDPRADAAPQHTDGLHAAGHRQELLVARDLLMERGFDVAVAVHGMDDSSWRSLDWPDNRIETSDQSIRVLALVSGRRSA